MSSSSSCYCFYLSYSSGWESEKQKLRWSDSGKLPARAEGPPSESGGQVQMEERQTASGWEAVKDVL